MLMRLMDYLKGQQITAVFTNLTTNNEEVEQTNIGISSLTDTWIWCRDAEFNGERNHCVSILKSRGLAHSNQVRELVMSPDGIRLVPPYIGQGLVLMGSARVAQEAKEKAEALVRAQEIEQKQETLELKRRALETQTEALRLDITAEASELERIIAHQKSRLKQAEIVRDAMKGIRAIDSERTIDSPMAKTAGDAK
jgi:circadian clock protein KaiC